MHESESTEQGRRDLAPSPSARPNPWGEGVGVGEVLADRYRIDEFIGAGGMAGVYRATDMSLGRTVALKLFVPGTAGHADAARQVSETRLLASLNHHALVTLFDAHLPERGHAFLVMEYIGGGTLDSRLRQGPLAPADAIPVALELGEALHVVHSAGIVHRDVKPSNILLRDSPATAGGIHPTLADFGIAYLVDATRLTAPGTAIGTAAYLAPEQVRGAAPTSASDIYALGLVLIEALTGRRAFAQQTPVEAIAARLSVQPDVPRSFGHNWRSLLTAMTSLDPESRPSARDVATRARTLGGPDREPEVTAISSALPTGPSRTAHSATLVLSAASRERASLASPPGGMLREQAGRVKGRDRSRRTAVVVGVCLAVLLALSIGGATWIAQQRTAPAQPDMPKVGEPLDSHLRELLDAVSP